MILKVAWPGFTDIGYQKLHYYNGSSWQIAYRTWVFDGTRWIVAGTRLPNNLVFFYKNPGDAAGLDPVSIPSTRLLRRSTTGLEEIVSSNESHSGSDHGYVSFVRARVNHSPVDSGGFFLSPTDTSHTHSADGTHGHLGAGVPLPQTAYWSPFTIPSSGSPYAPAGAGIFMTQDVEAVISYLWSRWDSDNQKFIGLTNAANVVDNGYTTHSHGNGYQAMNHYFANVGSSGNGSTWYRKHEHFSEPAHQHPSEANLPLFYDVSIYTSTEPVTCIEEIPRGALCCFTDSNIPPGFTPSTINTGRHLRHTTGTPGGSGGSASTSMSAVSDYRDPSSGPATNHFDSAKYKGGSGRYMVPTSHEHLGYTGESKHVHNIAYTWKLAAMGLYMATKD
jgi:hypothetical protein